MVGEDVLAGDVDEVGTDAQREQIRVMKTDDMVRPMVLTSAVSSLNATPAPDNSLKG